LNIDFNLGIKLKGRYRCQVIRSDGSVKTDIGWFDNLITNQGLDQLGGYQPAYNAGGPYILIACSVGTGTTAPAFTDTQLTAFGAATPTLGGAVTSPTSISYVAGPPAYWACIMTYTFSAGTATGTWSEIGVGNWTSPSDTQPWLFSHALITSGGSPTTITVLSSESLVVTYELDYHIDVTTNSYSFLMSSVTYSGSYLRSRITSAPTLNLTTDSNHFGNVSIYMNVYNGSIGTTTTSPSGSASGGPNGCSTSHSTYTNGTYFRQFQTSFATGQGNVSGGITAMEVVSDSAGSWQFSVSPAIPKTSSYQMQINYNISWARYP
jgi:hypothetical protein